MRVFIRIVLLYLVSNVGAAFAQQKSPVAPSASPLERVLKNGDAAFERGEYRTARNSYSFALNGLMYVDNQPEISAKLEKAKKIEGYYSSGFSAFHNENYDAAVSFFEKVLRENPKDKRVIDLIKRIKTVAGIPVPPPTNPKSPHERWLAEAQKLKKERKFAQAIAILTAEGGKNSSDPVIGQALEQIAILKEGGDIVITPISPCNEAKYASLRREMNKLYGDCQLIEAILKAKEILSMDCYQRDKFTLGSVTVFKDIQKQLRDIAEWKSGGDNSKREFIIPEYEKVFKKNRKCVEPDYFYYVYSSAEKMRADDPCSKNAVSRYLQAKRISENLVNKKEIDQKIAAIDKCTDCYDKTALFVQITNEAQSLFNQCRYDEAIKRYKDATPYNCSEKTQSIAKKWNEELIPQIERNKTQASRFVALKASADSLADLGRHELGKYEIALKKYQAADSIKLDCSKLNEQDIALKISDMQYFMFYEFRKTIRDALDRNIDFLERRAICGKVLVAISLADINKRIDFTDKNNLFELSCKTCAAEYPAFFKCPPPPLPLIAKDTLTKYQGLEFVANAFYGNPTISSVTRLTLPTWAWGGWGVGVNYVRSWGSFGEWKAGVVFSNNHFEVNQPFSSKENFDFQLVRLSTEFILKPKSKTNIYPFATFGAMVNIPVKFSYQAGNREMNNTNLLATGMGLKTGLGFVIERSVSVSITYDIADLFQAKAAETPLLINKSRYQTIGFNLGYRFLKYRKVK